MFGMGFTFVAIGLFLIDCAVQARHPITTLEDIVRDPGNTRTILTESKGQVEPSTGHPFTSATDSSGGSTNPSVYVAPNGGTTSPSSGGAGAPSSAAAAAVAYARAQIGKPYGWGQTGPNAFDCSGLTYMAYKSAGIKIGRTTSLQILNGKHVAKADLIPGDLVFPDPGHVQIYSGGGNIIEAPHTGEDIMERPMWGYWSARRIVPASTNSNYAGA